MARNRRRRSSKDAIIDGLMGAAIGGLNFKLNEITARQAEEAEARKMERLAVIQRGNAEFESGLRREENKQRHGFDMVQLDKTQEFQSGESAKTREHQFSLSREEQAAANARTAMSEAGANARNSSSNQTQLEVARMRAAQEQTDAAAGKGILGSDGITYPYGQALPAGVTPMGGYGVSWAPSASKSGAAGPRPGIMGSTPLTPQRDFSGFSAQPVQ